MVVLMIAKKTMAFQAYQGIQENKRKLAVQKACQNCEPAQKRNKPKLTLSQDSVKKV